MKKTKIKILWAVSSVGKGHIMRDLAIFTQLKRLADVDIDWLAPDPAGSFLSNRGHNVLECSSRLKGSGKTYDKIFSNCTEEFNLMEYTRADTRLHKHDFKVSATAWKESTYDVIIGDEAFWLLSGFASRWEKKPCPFIFLTDFIGTRAMRFRPRDLFTAWFNNFLFLFSHMGPDIYLYIGNPKEISDEDLGLFLPNRRKWTLKHCRSVKPIVSFDPKKIQDRYTLRGHLGLPVVGKIFMAAIGPEGDVKQRLTMIEQVFEKLNVDFPDAYFIMTCSEAGKREWIHYHHFLDNLYQYFAASDFVITQSGYGKVTELSALGVPFIAIPLEYHFEQEYVMGSRLDYYGVGKLVKMREHNPQSIAKIVRELINTDMAPIEVDTGVEVANIILNESDKNI